MRNIQRFYHTDSRKYRTFVQLSRPEAKHGRQTIPKIIFSRCRDLAQGVWDLVGQEEECEFKPMPFTELRCRPECVFYTCEFHGHKMSINETRESCIEASSDIYIERQTSLDEDHCATECSSICKRFGCTAQHMRDEAIWGDQKIDIMSLAFTRS